MPRPSPSPSRLPLAGLPARRRLRIRLRLSGLPALFLFLLLSGLAAASRPAAGPGEPFLRYWKSGFAEIASYKTVTERYGEMREAQTVLLFVHEEIDDSSRIKVETPRIPAARRVPVLKLNHALKFNTGIYDYSVMTSVFSGLSGPGVTRPFLPRKISLSAQEWCGQVYHQLLPRRDAIHGEFHSYFEAEGDGREKLALPPGELLYEDEMPILLRELDGPYLKPGESRAITLVPALWKVRKAHRPLALLRAVLSKTGPEKTAFAGGTVPAFRWKLEVAEDLKGRKPKPRLWQVEAKAPHRLLGWEEEGEEKAELLTSRRQTYWEENRNRHLPLRDSLRLRYGVGDASGPGGRAPR